MIDKIGKILTKKGLKVTPQRISVYKAICNSHIHPSTDEVITLVKKENSFISNATVYNILDSFVNHGIIEKIKTNSDVNRYDFIEKKHHHIYCNKSMKITDYYSEELDNMLEDFFSKNKIKDFDIKKIQVQIDGEFIK